MIDAIISFVSGSLASALVLLVCIVVRKTAWKIRNALARSMAVRAKEWYR